MLRKSIQCVMILILVALVAKAQGASMTLDDIGMISVKAEGAAGNGTTDDTAAINAAIKKAKNQAKALLFPPGTYLVSNTVEAFMPGEITGYAPDGRPKVNADTDLNPVIIIGSTSGATPVINLKANSTGFNSQSSPKPVIFFQCWGDEDGDERPDPGEVTNSANLFRCGIRNIKVDIGAGNAGAVGLDFDGSQGCFINNFEVDMESRDGTTRSGYAGLTSLIGQKGVCADITVRGGRYGIKPATTKYPAIVGLHLINQTEAAIYGAGQQMLQISGFKIEKAEAPAIVTLNSSKLKEQHIGLVDGTIEFDNSNGDYAIDNTVGRTVVMNNVYVQNASGVVKSGTGSTATISGTANGWTKVDEYVFPCSSGGRNLVNGSTNTNVYKTFTNNFGGSVPSDFLSRHVWNKADLPSADVIMTNANAGTPGYAVLPLSLRNGFCSAAAKNESGGALSKTDPDATATLQNLIDNNRFVLIPKGKFMVSKPIDLRANTVLQGVSNNLSGLHTHVKAWLNNPESNPGPTSTDYNRDSNSDGFPDGDSAIIRTPDSATAKTIAAHLGLRFGTLTNRDWHTAFLWRAGEQSFTIGLNPRARFDTETGGNPRSDMIFCGANVGGRHYGVGIGNDCRTGHTEHRRVYVRKGLSSSLALAFYNLNAEDNLTKPQITIQDSKNIVVYGSKNEDQPLIEFRNSDNCAVFGAQGPASFRFGASGTTAQDCNDVYAAAFSPKEPSGNSITEYYGGNTSTVTNSYALGVFKRGTCNFADLAITSGTITDNPAGAPGAPTGLTATADNTNHEIDLDWNNNSEADLSFYRVYRSSTSGGTYTSIAAPGASAFSDNSAEVTNGQTWYYKVSAIDTSDQESNLSGVASAALNDTLPPSAPVLASPTAGNQQVALDWNDVTDASQYRIYYSTVSNGQVMGSYQTTSSTSDKTVTGLTNGVKYYFKVTALDTASNESVFSNQVNSTPIALDPPDTPTNLAAASGDNQVALDWDGSGTSYQVFRSEVQGELGDEIATPTASNYTDTGLTNNITYYYAVTAVNSNGASAPCTAVSAAAIDEDPPSAPTGLSGDEGDGFVSLDWTDNADADLIGYNVYRRDDGDTTPTLLNSSPIGESAYIDDTVTNGNTYYYLVRAEDDDEWESAESDEVGPFTPADVTAPAAPTGLAATVGEGQIQLDWDANTDDDVAGYTVYRSAVTGGPYTLIESVTLPTYLDTDLDLATTYYYVVCAVDEVPNESDASSEVNALPNLAPAVPTGLTATAGDTQIILDWDDNTEGDLADYKVYRSTTAGSYGAAIATVTSSNYTATGLTNGVTYYFKVTARDAAQLESAKSDEVSEIPEDVTAPAAPTGLMATAGDAEVELVWNANAEGDLTDYRVYRSTTSGSYGSAIATVTSASYTDTGLTNETTYFYVVTARDEVPNESAVSAEASATPQGTGTTVYTFTSTAVDGWVLESGENTNVGGSINGTDSTTSALRIGDNNQKKQYKSILNFNTGPTLPDDVEIQSAVLKIKRGTSAGNTSGFGSIYVDVKTSNFNSNNALETADFAAGATATQVATMSYPSSDGTWSTGSLNAQGIAAVNLIYNTQFRVYFATDDDNDTANDYLGFYSNENATEANRPVLEVTVSGGGDDTTAPAAPSNLSATAGDTQVALNWDDNTENDLGHYNVKRSTTSGGPYTTIANVAQSAYTDTGRTNGTTYYYVISAVDQTDNESGKSSQQSATPADVTAPAVPTALTATAGNGQVVLNWTDNSDVDLVDYRVYRSTTSGSYGSALATVSTSAYTDSSVTNGVTYYYKVTARDEVPNESAKSSEVSARPIGGETTTTFAPAADAFCRSDSPTTNLGDSDMIRIKDTSADYYGFMKFSVTGVAGTISSAKLKLKSRSDATLPFTVEANAVSDTTWTEGGITWSNKPAFGSVLDSTTVSQLDAWSELDVSSHITGNGTFSIGLYNATVKEGRFHSKEATNQADRPYLEITYAGGASSSLQAVKGSVSSVGSASWTTVTLSPTFTSPVVVCTTNYTSSDVPAVVRVRNASGNKFDVKVQNPSGTALSGMTVQYLVVEEGVYTSAIDGVKMEARKITSSLTDGYTNGWLGQTVSTSNTYTTPIVLGQVMTANDSAWSQFWCSSESDLRLPPSNGAFALGKHVGEDTVLTRANETLGVVIIEAGAGTMGTMDYLAGRSANDYIRGMDNAPPYAVCLSGLSSASNAVVTQNAMEGDSGGWAVGYGSNWFSSTNLNLACDEDQVTDTERAHATEPVAYIVFE